MVAIGTTNGVICPKCKRMVSARTICNAREDRYGRTMRTYLGWCDREGCRAGFEVIQFAIGDDWHIHKYRYYAVDLPVGMPMPSKQWHVVNPLPAPAPVVTGPGGEYSHAIEISTDSFLKQIQLSLSKLAEAITGMIVARAIDKKIHEQE